MSIGVGSPFDEAKFKSQGSTLRTRGHEVENWLLSVTPRSQEWPLSVDVAPRTGMVVARI